MCCFVKQSQSVSGGREGQPLCVSLFIFLLNPHLSSRDNTAHSLRPTLSSPSHTLTLTRFSPLYQVSFLRLQSVASFAMSRLYPDNALNTSHYPTQDDYQYDTSYQHSSPIGRANNYSYTSEQTNSPPDDHSYAPDHDPTYPPLRSQQPVWSIPSPKLSINPYGGSSQTVPSVKTFGSSVDLETLATDDVPERPIQYALNEVRKTEVETGWRAAVSLLTAG